MRKILMFCAVLLVIGSNARGRGLLIRDMLPWDNSTAKEDELTLRLGAGGFDIITSAQIVSTNVSVYDFVILNVALEEGDIQALMDNGIAGLTSVEPSDKLATKWASIKIGH